MLATVFFHSNLGAPRAVAGYITSNEPSRIRQDGAVERTVGVVVNGREQTITTTKVIILKGDYGLPRPTEYTAFSKAELDALVANAMEQGATLLFDSEEYAGNAPAVPRQKQVIGNLLRERLSANQTRGSEPPPFFVDFQSRQAFNRQGCDG